MNGLCLNRWTAPPLSHRVSLVAIREAQEVPERCSNYEDSLQLPCDFDAMRKPVIGSGLFTRFLFNHRVQKSYGTGKRKSSYWQAISLMKCRLAAVVLVEQPERATGCWECRVTVGNLINNSVGVGGHRGCCHHFPGLFCVRFLRYICHFKMFVQIMHLSLSLSSGHISYYTMGINI